MFLRPLNASTQTNFMSRSNFDSLPGKYSTALDASFEEEFEYNPTFQLVKMNTLSGMKNNVSGSMIPVEEANRLGKHLGITFDEFEDGNVPSAYANFIISERQLSANRQEAIERYEGGLAGKAGLLGSSFLAAMIDPLNVLSGYIPFARLLGVGMRTTQVAGKTVQVASTTAKSRLATGATEGALGTAMLEPLIHYGSEQEKSQYSLADSFLSIGFGTVLGGGLHLGTGYLSDVMTRAGSKARVDALSNALDQVLNGEDVDVTLAGKVNPVMNVVDEERLLRNEIIEAIKRTAAAQVIKIRDMKKPDREVELISGVKVGISYVLRDSDEIDIDQIDIFSMEEDELFESIQEQLFKEFTLTEESPPFLHTDGSPAPKITEDAHTDTTTLTFREYKAKNKAWEFDNEDELDEMILTALIDLEHKRNQIESDIPEPRDSIRRGLASMFGKKSEMIDEMMSHQMYGITSIEFSGRITDIRAIFIQLAKEGIIKKGVAPEFVGNGIENFVFRPHPESDVVFKLSSIEDPRIHIGDKAVTLNNMTIDAVGSDAVLTKQYKAIHSFGESHGFIATIDEFVIADHDMIGRLFSKLPQDAMELFKMRLKIAGYVSGDLHWGNVGIGIRHGKPELLVIDRGLYFGPLTDNTGSRKIQKKAVELKVNKNIKIIKVLDINEIAAKAEQRPDVIAAKEEAGELRQDAIEGMEGPHGKDLEAEFKALDEKLKPQAEQARIIAKVVTRFANCLAKTGTL